MTQNLPEKSPKTINVLFLCTGNSARSIMAESILKHEGGGRFESYSAGSMPNGEVNPFALRLLKKLNHSLTGLRSKSWEEFSDGENGAPKLDFVFTVCDNAAGEVCPMWPGQPISAHWGLPDPAAATGPDAMIAAQFADCYRMLSNRISIFTSLPFATMSRMSLKNRLDQIGNSQEKTKPKTSENV